jgi:hypothetical protein
MQAGIDFLLEGLRIEEEQLKTLKFMDKLEKLENALVVSVITRSGFPET